MSSEILHICFDLDGTLINSARTIYKATLKTLDDLNIGYYLPEEEFNNIIGMHFVDIFIRFNIDVPDFEKFISHYKKVYFDFIDDSVIYNDVENTLEVLKKNSFKVSLLTTKAQEQTEKILQHFNLTKHFDFIMGRTNGIPHKPDPKPLIIICNSLNVPAEKSLMVGDTELDILCGKNANASTAAVTYGYRTIEQLKANYPDYIIESLNDLVNVVVKNF